MSSEPAFSENLVYRAEFESVATLADDPAGLTCSVTIGRKWAHGRAAAVVGYPRFELAAEQVRAGKHDLLLVPAAYPEIRNFFFDKRLRAIETFLGSLPDMVLAVPSAQASESFDVVFHHPATQLLVEGLSEQIGSVNPVNSNSVACREALAYEGAAAAVTNQTSADYYGLRTVKTLSTGTPMGFLVFARQEGQ